MVVPHLPLYRKKRRGKKKDNGKKKRGAIFPASLLDIVSDDASEKSDGGRQRGGHQNAERSFQRYQNKPDADKHQGKHARPERFRRRYPCGKSRHKRGNRADKKRGAEKQNQPVLHERYGGERHHTDAEQRCRRHAFANGFFLCLIRVNRIHCRHSYGLNVSNISTPLFTMVLMPGIFDAVMIFVTSAALISISRNVFSWFGELS